MAVLSPFSLTYCTDSKNSLLLSCEPLWFTDSHWVAHDECTKRSLTKHSYSCAHRLPLPHSCIYCQGLVSSPVHLELGWGAIPSCKLWEHQDPRGKGIPGNHNQEICVVLIQELIVCNTQVLIADETVYVTHFASNHINKYFPDHGTGSQNEIKI